MQQLKSTSRVGVHIDASSVYRNGEGRMRYDVLREFASRNGSEVVRLNAHLSNDAKRARVDPAYRSSVSKFFTVIRNLGHKAIIKDVKWYREESGEGYARRTSISTWKWICYCNRQS